MLKHERALQISLTVQTRREPEVSFEQCTRLPKQVEHCRGIHCLPFPMPVNQSDPTIVYKSTRRSFSPGFRHSKQGQYTFAKHQPCVFRCTRCPEWPGRRRFLLSLIRQNPKFPHLETRAMRFEQQISACLQSIAG